MSRVLAPERRDDRRPAADNPPRVADLVARTLHAFGVREAFGMPGGEVVTLLDALGEAGIRFVLTRHETAAAIAAGGASLARPGAPGVLVTTLGPGLANAVNGIADAMQERVPLLVVSGVVDRSLRARYTHQIVDQPALLRAVVKGSFEVEAEGAAETIARAVRLALAPPMGPVHLDLAPGIAAALAQGDPVAPTIEATPSVDPADPALASLRALLAAAERPLVLAGFEAARDGAGPALRALADAGVPVLTTYKAKGVLDETHPFALGAAGLSPKADAMLRDVVRGADLVLLPGYDPIEMRPGWLEPFGAEASVVDLTRHAADHGMHRVDRRLIGSPAALLASIGRQLSPPARGYWPDGTIPRAKAALAAAFAPGNAWGPGAVFDALQRALPENAVVTVDSGAHRILLSQQFSARRPLAFLQSAGWCTMGAALPLAIGTAVARPEAPVVAVIGDGGLEMVAGELGTLRDANLPVVLVVLQDAKPCPDRNEAAPGRAEAGRRAPRPHRPRGARRRLRRRRRGGAGRRGAEECSRRGARAPRCVFAHRLQHRG